MNLAAPLLLSFGGGIASFASPCVLPLVPVYLSVLTGFQVATVQGRERSSSASLLLARDAGLFVAGFTGIFVLLGTTASFVGHGVGAHHLLFTQLAGILIVVLAVFLAGSQLLYAPRLYREWHPRPGLRRVGPLASVGAGAAFGFAWTPCIGPILASILTVASTQGEAGRGALLLGAYSLGLGLPFIVCGLLLGRLQRPMAWLRRHLRLLTFVSAGVMVILGVLILTGQLSLIDTTAGGL